MGFIITALSMLREYAADVHALMHAEDLRGKIKAGLALARKVAAKTPTPADDAVIALVDRVGEEKAIDAIEAILDLFDGDPEPGPVSPDNGGRILFGAAPDESRDKRAAEVAASYGISLPVLIQAALAIKALIEFIGQFRGKSESAPSYE